MRISAEQMGYLLAECFNAISPNTDAADAARWKGRVGELMGRALRRDPDDVLWALEGCEVVSAPDGAGSTAQGYAAPSEADRVWNMLESDRIAKRSDDYAIPSDMDEMPDDVRHDLAGMDAGNYEIGPNDYDLPDPPDEDLRESAPRGEDVPVPSDERQETHVSSTGFLCTAPGLDRASIRRIRNTRGSWVKSAAYDSVENGGRMDLVSIFVDGATNSSWAGYEDLVKPHRAMGGCFEEAMWMEGAQDDIPMLRSLPEGIVIDFPGIRPRGTNGEYGILRMERGKNSRWKVGFVWIAMVDAASRTHLLSDKVRLAVFVKPEGKK